ncbi:hypothetical protein Tco_1231335 [Tanacetum coccineum]
MALYRSHSLSFVLAESKFKSFNFHDASSLYGKLGRPGEYVVGNSSGTAWIKEPQAFAKMSVEIEDTLDGVKEIKRQSRNATRST